MNPDNTESEIETIRYAIEIKAELDDRLSGHIRALKHLEGRGYTKQRWIQEAIKEKLEVCRKADDKKIRRNRKLNFIINRQTHEEITKILGILKEQKVRGASKTEFFLEAILEKLERDQLHVKALFDELLQKALKNNTSASK